MGEYHVLEPAQQQLADATMWTLMKAGMAENAFDYFAKTIYDEGENSNPAVTVDRKTMIYYLFLQAGIVDYSDFQTSEELEEFYYQIKFCLRRLDFGLKQELQEEALIWLRESAIPETILEAMIERDCIHKEQVREKLKKGIPVLHEEVTESSETDITDGNHIFSFILCVNQEMWFDEILHYIDRLWIPDGYRIEIIPVFHAAGMTEGYNRGMHQASGKYKIYMHQDVFLYGRTMLQDILDTFAENPSAGILGVAGCTRIPEDYVWWGCTDEEKYMNLYQDTMLVNKHTRIRPDLPSGSGLLILDGVLLVTSVDIEWREDLFHGFHFYDLSQCMEFHRAGYRAVVPKQTQIWCLHEQSCSRSLDYSFEEARLAFREEYGGDLDGQHYLTYL